MDAVLCAGGRVTDLARLSLVPEFGRGHGALYDAVNAGGVDLGRVRWLMAAVPLPRWADGRIRLAVDACSWPRPAAEASPERAWCHVHGKGDGARERVAGWPYSFVAALGPGPSSWAPLLDAVRLGPGDEDWAVTAAQLREVVGRLRAAGQWKEGDPEVIITMDAGYSPAAIGWALRDLPVIVVARVRSDRVYYRPAPPRPRGLRGGHARHGEPLRCDDPATQHSPHVEHEGLLAGGIPAAVDVPGSSAFITTSNKHRTVGDRWRVARASASDGTRDKTDAWGYCLHSTYWRNS